MKVAVLLPLKVYPSNSQAFLSFIQRENTPAVKIFSLVCESFFILGYSYSKEFAPFRN